MSRGKVAAIVTALAVLSSTGAQAYRRVQGLPIPPGYRVAYKNLARGVDMFTLNKPGLRVVRVIRLRHDSPYRLRTVLSQNLLYGPKPRTERTTTMCKRVKCLAAINGDFFSKMGVPVGGMVSAGEGIRSSEAARPHVVLDRDGGLSIQSALRFGGTITARYPVRALDKTLYTQERSFPIHGLNEPRKRHEIIAYTPRFGGRTATKEKGVELVLRVPPRYIASGGGPRAEVSWRHVSRNSKIPRDGIVLSSTGDGARALEQLWKDVRAGAAEKKVSLDVEVPGIEAIAGNPVLLRNGEGAYPRSNNSLVRSKNPRSIVGWTKQGDILLVTVDGRRRGYSSGMSVPEAAWFMKVLGAVDAMNLDGGGSSTMVVRGKVVNRPSDRLVWRNGTRVSPYGRGYVIRDWWERPVANALAIVAG